MSEQTTEERFWKRVVKTETCWLWMGGKANGYGRFFYGGKATPAHHFLLPEATEKKSLGLLACHKCDVRNCVRPDHIFWGTYSDNMVDCVAKGRHGVRRYEDLCKNRPEPQRGEDNPASKLTVGQVVEIKTNRQITQLSFARKYGVTKTAISLIRRGINWGWVKPKTEGAL